MARNYIFQAIKEAEIWIKFIKIHTPCRDFKIIKNASNLCRNGWELPFFISLKFSYIYGMCVIKVVSFKLPMQDSHPGTYSTKTFYHLYISDPFWDSAQKMLTALFKLVLETQKSMWTIF